MTDRQVDTQTDTRTHTHVSIQGQRKGEGKAKRGENGASDMRNNSDFRGPPGSESP